ncbi:hypothetical protein F2P79_021026, partial [Pimephales promelas]
KMICSSSASRKGSVFCSLRRPSAPWRRTGLTVGRPASHKQTARHHSPVDHDIIDLIHPTTDANNHKDTLPFTPEAVWICHKTPWSNTALLFTRLPGGISMLLGSREHIPHSIATEAVTVQERRALRLSNYSGSAHPLDGGEPACVRKLLTRSIWFRDHPTNF